MKKSLTYVYDLNKRNVKDYTDGFLLEDFYLPANNKEITEIGLIYITPNQVMAAAGCGFNHDGIVDCIQNTILDGKQTSRIYLRCYRIYEQGTIEDAYAWGFNLIHKKNKYMVTEITHEMLDVASCIQSAIETIAKSKGIKLDKDICISLRDAIIADKIKIVGDKSQLQSKETETIYGYSLSDYMAILKKLIEKYSIGLEH